ncbi:MAG: caspase family protein [Candidatus Poribacteria bacterium]|nr:caspase family protein [Candidatus Poribacteria bacterium]
MKNRFINLALIVLISMSAVGCSAVRYGQTRAGIGAEKTVGASEERKTKLSKRDFRLGFNATENQLGVRLEYRPYYSVERQQVVTYSPSKATPSEIIIGSGYVGVLIWVLSDVLVKTGEVAVNDEGELYDVTEFDWGRMNSIQRIALAGIVVDSVLWGVAYGSNVTVREPWRKSGEVAGEWQFLKNHPYRIEMPSYNFGKDYLSKSGNENILIRDFLSGVEKPARFGDIRSVSLRASTRLDNRAYQKNLNLSAQAQLQPFQDAALAARNIDMISVGKPRLMPRPETNIQWNTASIRAGSVAALRVTVKNTGKGTLYRLTARTTSKITAFNNRELKFGKIAPGASITVPVSFEIDKLMRTQEILIGIKFSEHNDHVPANIETKFNIIEKSRPKFDYAYRIIDGDTETSVGNGDGIFQRGESADIFVTVRNSGEGNAAGVTAKLNPILRTGVDMYGETSVPLQTLAPGESKTATFNVGVKRGANISRLSLNLSIEENNFGTETKLTDTIILPIGRVTAPKVKALDLVATITSNSAQVYNGASNQTPISAEIPGDSQVKVSGQLGEWYRVQLNVRDEALTGWVHKGQIVTTKISKQESSPVEKPAVVEVFQNTPPTLELFEPKQQRIIVEERAIPIQAIAIANKGLKNVSVTVNGKVRNIARPRGNTTQQTPRTVFRIQENILLNYGLNTIELHATDIRDRVSETVTLSVIREREQVRNDYALLFGVNSYEHFDPWHKLNNPIPDAEAIRDELKSKYGFKVELVSDPSRDGVLTKINEYTQKQYNKNDQLLIFFAGHGYFEETNDAGIGYLVASDTLPPDADRGKSSYISHGDLRNRIENIGCEHIFLMIDACFSGTFDPTVAQFNRGRSASRIPDNVSKKDYIKQTLAYKSRWYLTSGGKEYVSDGAPNQHSPFTRRILDAFRSGGGQHGILTLDDIRRYVEKTTPQPRVGEFGTNAPGSNFLFIRKVSQ